MNTETLFTDASGAAKRRTIIYVTLSTVAILVAGVIYFIRSVEHRVRNDYAGEWAGGLIVDYLRQHDDRRPASWNDLRPVYEQHVAKLGRPWSFDELQQRVEIDWNVDIDELRHIALDDRRPTVIDVGVKDGDSAYFQNGNPNELIRNYFRERQAK